MWYRKLYSSAEYLSCDSGYWWRSTGSNCVHHHVRCGCSGKTGEDRRIIRSSLWYIKYFRTSYWSLHSGLHSLVLGLLHQLTYRCCCLLFDCFLLQRVCRAFQGKDRLPRCVYTCSFHPVSHVCD
ncbi:hypothetical protein D3C71_1348990 [compost metagenome]